MRLRDLGTCEFSWSDLRAILNHLPHTSAYVRATDPEAAAYGSAEAQLRAVQVNMLSEIRWLLAMSRFEDIPAQFGPVYYGPKREQDEVEQVAAEPKPAGRSVEEKRAIARRARMRAVGAA